MANDASECLQSHTCSCNTRERVSLPLRAACGSLGEPFDAAETAGLERLQRSGLRSTALLLQRDKAVVAVSRPLRPGGQPITLPLVTASLTAGLIGPALAITGLVGIRGVSRRCPFTPVR
jgi:hypothetical protein